MVSGTQTVNETLYRKKPYHLMQGPRADRSADRYRHGAGVTPIGAGEDIGPSMLALAKAKPGTINYGSSGPGSETTTWPASF